MKLKKILIILLLFFVGMVGIKADNNQVDISETSYIDSSNDNFYDIIGKVYRIVGAETYYENYSSTIDSNEDAATKAARLNKLWDDAYSAYNIGDLGITKAQLIEYYGILHNQGTGAFVHRIVSDLGYNEEELTDIWSTIEQDAAYAILFGSDGLASKGDLPTMLRYLDKVLITTKTEENEAQYNYLTGMTNRGFTNFCDYLSKHPGIQYYVKIILRIISYVAIGLAILLGGVDFAEAILSNEDSALTKAFQKFVKRLVAAVLVFLAYLIVQIFLGLVSKIPAVNDASFEICEELKIGSLNG